MSDRKKQDDFHDEEDDKPTVVLDLNALKAQAKEQQEELDDLASDLEFSATPEEPRPAEKPESDSVAPAQAAPDNSLSLDLDDDGEEDFLELSDTDPLVVLFDHNSEFFSKNKEKFPEGFKYKVVSDLKGLNTELQTSGPKAVVFNYNASPKAANQLCAQIRAKFPESKTLIMAKNLSDEKAQAHKKTKSGANGYVSAPFKMDTFKKVLLDLFK